MPSFSLGSCSTVWFVFFFNDPAPTEIYTLSLHDALPISADAGSDQGSFTAVGDCTDQAAFRGGAGDGPGGLTLVAVGLDGPFFIFHMRPVHAGCVFDCPGQNDGI